MKKIISVFALVFLFSNAFAKNTINTNFTSFTKAEGVINDFINSKQFEKLKNTFNLANEDFDFNNADKQMLENGKVVVLRLKVSNNSKTNYLTILKTQNKENFSIIYEKNNLNEKNTEGYIEHYNENGEFYADFKVIKKGDLYSFKINDVGTSKRLNISTAVLKDACLTSTYSFIKKTCEADTTCDFLCDMVETCHIQMAILAAAHCAAN